MLQAIISYIPQLTQQPSPQPQATSLPQTRATLPQNGQPSMTCSVDHPPHFSPESNQTPSGGAAKCPKPAPSVSAHSFPDLNTLSSNSTDSLREQLRLVNQRSDDVRRTLRTKDERDEDDSVWHVRRHNVPAFPNDSLRDCPRMRANQYVATEILVAEKREDQKRPWAEPSRGPPPRLPRRRTERGEQTIPRSPNISLNSTRTEIFLQIREKGLLKAPNLMRSQDEDRDRRRYYHFHSNYGHDTEEWYDLKNQIKDLIRRDHLDRYIMKPRKPSLYPKGPVERQVDFIVGGPTAGGVSSLARKAYARMKIHKRPRPRS
ncbi:hypothetical protein BHM03_00007312 [Ensete ventricosum]|nr:hypothetical protein BHM03_00007312 [Ensete ventricosum]